MKLSQTQLSQIEAELQGVVYSMTAEYAQYFGFETPEKLTQLKRQSIGGESYGWIRGLVIDYLCKHCQKLDLPNGENAFWDEFGGFNAVGDYADRITAKAFDALILEATLNATN